MAPTRGDIQRDLLDALHKLEIRVVVLETRSRLLVAVVGALGVVIAAAITAAATIYEPPQETAYVPASPAPAAP